MKPTITDLWRGNITPWSDRAEESEERSRLLDKLDELHNDLMARLDEEGKKIFEAFEDRRGDLTQMELEQAFCKGFTLGSKIMLETLSEK